MVDFSWKIQEILFIHFPAMLLINTDFFEKIAKKNPTHTLVCKGLKVPPQNKNHAQPILKILYKNPFIVGGGNEAETKGSSFCRRYFQI